MHRNIKLVYAACFLATVLLVILAVSAAFTFVPESKVQFTSLTLTGPNQTVCTGQHACLNVDMRFDCQFQINMPDTELPHKSEAPLTRSERAELFLGGLSVREALPMGVGSVSIPLASAENCEILVDDKTTYNVVPGSPLAVAKMVDENGLTRTVYVSAERN